MSAEDFDAALAEQRLDEMQFTAKHVAPETVAAWMRDTNDHEAIGTAIRSLTRLHTWLGDVLRGLKD